MISDQDIAVIGMSCRLPGAKDLEQFWRNLAGGVESITRLPGETRPGYVNAAPLLDDPARFDAAFFGFSPQEARTMDPQQRILLELAHEALEHAGYDPARQDARVGVFAGCALNTYFTSAGLHGRIADDYIATLIANDKDFLATRISYKLNLKGPSLTVQTACSTSLVAVHLARQSLLCGESDMALVGAISVRVPHRAGYRYDEGGVVSPDARVRAFDAKANGTVFGSGGGVLVLTRLADALAERACIHAVIKGSAVNNDGSDKAGYSAPSVAAQADAVVEALANAGVDADAVSYVEAHGSGTPVGDPIEVSALARAFRVTTQRRGYCALGSVKTNVGHLDAAAGLAGLIKTVLALKHRQLPPSLHYTAPNPEIDFPSTPFYVNTALKPWASAGARIGGVMATGMGGTNACVVLEEAPAPIGGGAHDGPQLLQLSAKTASALDNMAQRLREYAESNDVNLADAAHTLRVGRKAFAHRGYMVCANREGVLAAPLHAGHARAARRPLVLMLPGMGDQYVGMGHDLYQGQRVFRREVDRCAEILQPLLGRDIRKVLYPEVWKPAGANAGIDLRRMLHRESTLRETLVAQPALFSVEYAMARLWQSLGVVPDAIVGHSMGEYVAACLAGVLSLEDALRLLATRAKLVNALPEAAMLAVTLPENELAALLPPQLSICLMNGPSLCVVAGAPPAVAALEAQLVESGAICRRVQNAHAFHSRMLEPIAGALEQQARKIRFAEPRIPYISNVSGTWIKPGEAADPAYWALHATRTARFSDALRSLWQLADPLLLEAGPGRTLCVLAQQHPDRPQGAGAMVSSLRHDYENQPDAAVLCHAAGQLWLAGIETRWNAEGRRKVPLPTYPFEGEQHWFAPAQPAQKKLEPGSWLYAPSWKRLPASGAGLAKARWLVLADECGLGAALAARLTAAGHDVTLVRPGHETPDPREHECIVHACSVTHKPLDSPFAQFYSLLSLARACSPAPGVKLFVVSNHLQEVTGAEPLSPEKSTVLGPCMVIRQEYPNIAVKSIDVDSVGEAGAQLVLGELAEPGADVFVAYRNRSRWVQSYERFAPAPAAAPAFRQGGVYLITGGFGTVGTAISEYLAQKYGAKLVLVGRRFFHSKENVLCVQADVADAGAMRDAVEQAVQRFGALHGVIHGAGLVGPDGSREIRHADAAHCERHFRAKAHGVRALEEALEGRPLDFCLLLSSLTSVLGGIGQAAYAAANIYMDTFARRRNRAGGAPWLSVNWDVWRLGEARVEPGAGTTLRDFGMSAPEALQTMETVLALPRASQIVVSTGDLDARIEQWVRLVSLQKTAPKKSTTSPEDETESRIASVWQAVLGVEDIGLHDNFADLGGHSLLAIRIVAQLRQAFDIDLPVRALFDAPTIAQLSRYVEERVRVEVEALTDEQAAQLVPSA